MTSRSSRRTAMLLMLGSIVCSAPTAAETTTPPPSQVKRQRLRKGQAAPFAGVLLSNAALAKLINDLELKVKLCQVEREREQREAKAQAKAAKLTCKAKVTEFELKFGSCLADLERREKIWDNALKQCNKPTPWYRSPVFGFVMGNVVATGLCVGVSRVK